MASGPRATHNYGRAGVPMGLEGSLEGSNQASGGPLALPVQGCGVPQASKRLRAELQEELHCCCRAHEEELPGLCVCDAKCLPDGAARAGRAIQQSSHVLHKGCVVEA